MLNTKYFSRNYDQVYKEISPCIALMDSVDCPKRVEFIKMYFMSRTSDLHWFHKKRSSVSEVSHTYVRRQKSFWQFSNAGCGYAVRTGVRNYRYLEYKIRNLRSRVPRPLPSKLLSLLLLLSLFCSSRYLTNRLHRRNFR